MVILRNIHWESGHLMQKQVLRYVLVVIPHVEVYMSSLGYLHLENIYFQEEARIDVISFVCSWVGEGFGKCEG